MAKLYTEKQMAKVLRDLQIAPMNGNVDANEAARILTWRAKEEQGFDFEYQATAVRQHVRYGHFQPGTVDQHTRGSKYPVDQVFTLPLAPKRRAHRKDMAGKDD